MRTNFIQTLTLLTTLLLISVVINAQKSVNGLVTEEVKTKNGIIKITHTGHLPKGKTISGTIVAGPESDNPKKQQKQLDELAKLVFKVGNEIISNSGVFTTFLPDTETVPLKIFSQDGKLVEEILLDMTKPVENLPLDLPQTLRAENIEKITGSFSGDISNAKVVVNEQNMNVIAGNESELFFETAGVETGKKELSLDYDENQAIEKVNVVDYTLNAGKLNLMRGESTFLDVKVIGLEDLQEPLQLEVKNQSVGTVTLEGGDLQNIKITPEEVAGTGIWEKRFDIQSLTRGSFSVYTNLEVPETDTENNIPEDAANYIDEVVSTGEKTGIIGQMKLSNPTSEMVNAVLNPCFVPGAGGTQSFTVPEKREIKLLPKSEKVVELEGFCNDMELAAPVEGSKLVPAKDWFQLKESDNVEIIQDLMVQEDIQKITLKDLKTPLNIPGTDLPVTHAFNPKQDSELYKRLLLLSLNKIIEAYKTIENEGQLNPAFKEGDQEKTVQAAFWDYAEKLKGNEADKEILEEKLEPQLPENLWNNIELIGAKAKIYPEGLFQVKDGNECEYILGEQPGFQFKMKIADSWKDEDDREQIIREARESIQTNGSWSADSTFYEGEGGLVHNPTSVSAFFNGSIIGGFASAYARAYVATTDDDGRRRREWVSSTEQLSVNIDTMNIVQMEVIPKPGWSSFVVGSSFVKLLASSSAFDAVAGNAENSLTYLKVIKFAGAVALKYLASGSKQSFKDYAKDKISDELKGKIEEEAIRQITELAEQYLDDYSHQTGKTIEEIVGDVISPPDLEEMLERFLGVEITTLDELLDEGIDASLNLLLVSNTYCTANGGMVVKIDNAGNSGFVYSRAHYAREELEDNAVSQTGAIIDTFYVSNVRPNSISIETTGIASMMARARGNGQADSYLESTQIKVFVGVCKGPAGQFDLIGPQIFISDYKHDEENSPELGEDVLKDLVQKLENKIDQKLDYRSSQQDWRNVVDEFVRELSQDKFR